MIFNINNTVKVKLTQFGHNILAGEKVTPKVDEEGYSTFQFWELMQHFGVYMYNGGLLPFQTDIILSGVKKDG